MVFDTGSPYLVIDSTFAADSRLEFKNLRDGRIGGGASNHSQRVKFVVREMNYFIGNQLMRSQISPILPLKETIGDHADGIIGIEGLENAVIAIDYEHEQIGFWDRLTAQDTLGYTAVPCRFAKSRIYVPVAITLKSGITIKGDVLLDLGSTGTITLTNHTACQYRLSNISPLLHYYMLYAGIGGDASGADFRSKNVKVGNFDIIDMIIDFSNQSKWQNDKRYRLERTRNIMERRRDHRTDHQE